MAGKLALAIMGIVGVALGVGGTLGWQTWKADQVKASAQALEQRVRLHLADPESAKFRDLQVMPHSKAICGAVNAKNRMGGYVGFTDFVLLPDDKIHFHPGEPSKDLSTRTRIEGMEKLLAFMEIYERHCFAPEQAASSPAAGASR